MERKIYVRTDSSFSGLAEVHAVDQHVRKMWIGVEDWVIRSLGGSGSISVILAAMEREHSSAELLGASTSIHRALQRFEPVDLPLRLCVFRAHPCFWCSFMARGLSDSI